LQVKGSDTSTAESGSEAEDIASPKAMKSYSHLRLTPVREEVSLDLLIWLLIGFIKLVEVSFNSLIVVLLSCIST